MNFNAPILVIVPPRTAAGSRSDPRLGLGVIYGDFGEAALLMHRTRQQVWCWLIGHDATEDLDGALCPAPRPVAPWRAGALTRSAPCLICAPG
jgi:hypothetical protein